MVMHNASKTSGRDVSVITIHLMSMLCSLAFAGTLEAGWCFKLMLVHWTGRDDILSGARPVLCFPKCFLSIEFLLLVNYYRLCLYQIVILCHEISQVCWCRKPSKCKHTIFWTQAVGKVIFGANEVIRNILWDLVQLCILWSMILWSMQEYMTLYLSV